MSTEKRPATKADGWIQTAVGAFVVVITTFTTFSSTIHEYIDKKIEEQNKDLVRQVGAVGAGQMAIVMDTTLQVVALYYDSTCTRLNNVEELIGVRPSNRTIITPPDTVAIKKLQHQMRQVEEGIELILDGQAKAAGERRPRRAHNAYPQ